MKIFYSWQSDLEKEITSNAIRFAIKTAIPLIEQEYGEVSIIFDEATRGEAGSPHIPETIFSKIKNSDVFICDITHIVELQIKESVNKKIPNPNVLIELGYAIPF
ncbi:hypothetical protein [uncultured Chryseobacterium sp.]|jgi:hypothetical protein|uniref:hypothetical protein n=1 Tax=uncultured Chryseobacterium sp. TaxID=259322 RepID=UPI00260B534A|nr:hypothetical protein [uncultured Chryseobacterium sp.]